MYSIDKLIKDTDTMTLFDKVSEDIKDAMKARDKVRLMTLRNIKKVFLEAGPRDSQYLYGCRQAGLGR